MEDLEQKLTEILQQSKAQTLTQSFLDVCELCGGSGWIPYWDEEDNVERMKKCKCHPSITGEYRLRFANIPEKYKNVKREDTKETIYTDIKSRGIMAQCLKGINIYMNNFEAYKEKNKSLYLWSSVKGSGKTRMMCCIANELLDQGIRVKFATSTAILQEIKTTWDKNSEYTESRLIDDLVNTDVLIIDDFGTEKPTRWVDDKFYHIINQRYISNKLTFFTSNTEIGKLEYDERIKNRIMENVISVHFPEESIRNIIAQSDTEIFRSEVMNK